MSQRIMHKARISRRQLLRRGGAAVAGLGLLQMPLLARAFPSRPGEEVIPFLESPLAPEVVNAFRLLNWAELDTWITPNEQFFHVARYGKAKWLADQPVIDAQQWKLEVAGLVEKPMRFTLGDLKARPRQEVTFTLECSGNRSALGHGLVGNATWAGTPLAPLLKAAGVQDKGIEVVFIGSDTGEEEVRSIKMTQNFARSMSLADAINPNNLLCYAMNGSPLPQSHGFPLRLIAQAGMGSPTSGGSSALRYGTHALWGALWRVTMSRCGKSNGTGARCGRKRRSAGPYSSPYRPKWYAARGPVPGRRCGLRRPA